MNNKTYNIVLFVSIAIAIPIITHITLIIIALIYNQNLDASAVVFITTIISTILLAIASIINHRHYELPIKQLNNMIDQWKKHTCITTSYVRDDEYLAIINDLYYILNNYEEDIKKYKVLNTRLNSTLDLIPVAIIKFDRVEDSPLLSYNKPFLDLIESDEETFFREHNNNLSGMLESNENNHIINILSNIKNNETYTITYNLNTGKKIIKAKEIGKYYHSQEKNQNWFYAIIIKED